MRLLAALHALAGRGTCSRWVGGWVGGWVARKFVSLLMGWWIGMIDSMHTPSAQGLVVPFLPSCAGPIATYSLTHSLTHIYILTQFIYESSISPTTRCT